MYFILNIGLVDFLIKLDIIDMEKVEKVKTPRNNILIEVGILFDVLRRFPLFQLFYVNSAFSIKLDVIEIEKVKTPR